MGNRRSKHAARVKRAPADPAGGEVYSSDQPPRGVWGWAMTVTKMVLGVALILGSVLGIAWGVFHYAKTTPRFALTDIAVEGTRRLSRDDILAAAGLKLGENLFSLDVEAAQRALTQSPWVKQAKVTRQLPNRVLVQVHERQAQASLLANGKTFLVDETGQPFKEVGIGDPHDLALITGLSLDAFAHEPELEHERLRGVLALIREYEHLGIAQAYPAEEAHLDASGAVTLSVGSNGIALHLGHAPFKQRLLRAERVLTRALRQGGTPSVVFLDNEAHPERVVVRLQ